MKVVSATSTRCNISLACGHAFAFQLLFDMIITLPRNRERTWNVLFNAPSPESRLFTREFEFPSDTSVHADRARPCSQLLCTCLRALAHTELNDNDAAHSPERVSYFRFLRCCFLCGVLPNGLLLPPSFRVADDHQNHVADSIIQFIYGVRIPLASCMLAQMTMPFLTSRYVLAVGYPTLLCAASQIALPARPAISKHGTR